MLKKLVKSYESELNDLEYDIHELREKNEISPYEIEVFIDNIYYISDIRRRISDLIDENEETIKKLDGKLLTLFEKIELLKDEAAKISLKKAFWEILKPYVSTPTPA